jgi:hypothetical protein
VVPGVATSFDDTLDDARLKTPDHEDTGHQSGPAEQGPPTDRTDG